MRCDVIAQGIIAAAEELHLKVPIMVRLQGTVSSAQNGIKVYLEFHLDQGFFLNMPTDFCLVIQKVKPLKVYREKVMKLFVKETH